MRDSASTNGLMKYNQDADLTQTIDLSDIKTKPTREYELTRHLKKISQQRVGKKFVNGKYV